MDVLVAVIYLYAFIIVCRELDCLPDYASLVARSPQAPLFLSVSSQIFSRLRKR
jgi:hypothetical protein